MNRGTAYVAASFITVAIFLLSRCASDPLETKEYEDISKRQNAISTCLYEQGFPDNSLYFGQRADGIRYVTFGGSGFRPSIDRYNEDGTVTAISGHLGQKVRSHQVDTPRKIQTALADGVRQCIRTYAPNREKITTYSNSNFGESSP